MRRVGLCTLIALVLLIILQLSLMGNKALGAMASESEDTTSTQPSQPIGQPSSGVLFTESVGLLNEPAGFQVPANGPEFEEFHFIPNAWPIGSNEDMRTFNQLDYLNSRASKTAQANENVELMGQIGGRSYAVAVDDDIAYFGVGPRLIILDISNPANIQVLGQTEVLPGLIRDVVVAGSYAYVATEYGGLRIIDVSTPTALIEVGFVDTAGYAQAVTVAGSYAYVADNFSGLRIIDISTPTAPSEVAFVDTPDRASGVVVAGNYAYVADYSSGLRIIDVSTPAAPSEVGFFDTTGHARRVAVAGSYAYVADESSGLRIIDVSTPAAPSEVGFFDMPSDFAWDVTVAGSYAYVASYYNGLRIIDVSTPAAPSEVGFVNSPRDAQAVAVAGNYAYVVNHTSGLRIIDVSTPAAPSEVGFIERSSYVSDVEVVDSYAYVAAASRGLRIIDVSPPTASSEVGFLDTQGSASGVVIAGSYAYVADYSRGLRIIDVSTPTAPSEVGFVDTQGDARDVAVAGSYAYVADSSNGLRIIDVSTPAAPNEVGFVDTPGEARGVAVAGNYAYVADSSNGLRIIDVSTPTAPSEVGFYNTLGNAHGVSVVGSHAYVASYSSGLHIIDVSTPTAPSEVGFVDTLIYAQAVTVAGSYAYVADGYRGLRIIDVSTPAAPNEVSFYNTPGYAQSVAVAGSDAYVADANGGLTILRFTDPNTFEIAKSAPTMVAMNAPITYTLTITNSGQVSATNLTITDTLPAGANYVSGGTLAGNVVSWNVPTLPPTSTISVQFVVTATQTITNSDYGVTADGGYSATGSEVVVRVIGNTGCVAPPPDMVAWWTLDETSGTTAIDLIGGNNGTHINGPTPVLGKVDGALSFDGVNDYVEVDHDPIFNAGTGDFSIDAWIKTSDASGVKVILDKREESTSVEGYVLYLYQGALGFQIGDGPHTNYLSNVFIADGQWHHIAVTVDRDQSDGGKWYLDGQEVGTRFNPTGRSGSLNNTRPLRIGSRSSSISGLINATIDEVELFHRVLDGSEIQAIYNANSAGKCKGNSLLAIYALAFDTLAAHDLSWTYPDVMQGLRAATASDPSKTAIVVVDMPGADNTLIYELEGGNETLISGLPESSGSLSSAIHEYDMTDGATLGGFLLWVRNTYSADKTTFSYVGHGGPLIPETDFEAIFSDTGNLMREQGNQRFPSRVDVSPGFTDITPERKVLSVYQLSEALRIGTNDGTNPFDVADLVHCFASNIEEYVALYPYTDAMTGSPHYAFFAPEMLGEALDGINPRAEANTIADSIIQQYDSVIASYDGSNTPADDHPRILVALDSDKIPAIKEKWDQVSYYLWQNFDKTKIVNAYTNSAHYDTTYCEPEDWQLASPDAVVDLKTFATKLEQEFGSPVSVPVNTLLLRIDEAIINSYRQNGVPWFADNPQPTWNFDNNSGIGIYADFVGTPRGGDIHRSWHADFYNDTPTNDNPHPYAFLQGGFAGINWGDVFNRFWQNTPNLDRDACLPEFPPLLSSGELAVSEIIFPRLATVTDGSPVQLMAAISTTQAAVNTTVAFTVTQSSTTVFADVVHIPGRLVTGTHPVQASQAWVPALANPAVAEPFTVEVMVDHDNHVLEPNELNNVLTMSDVVAAAPALPRPIITATIPNNLQWITDTMVSLNVVQQPSTQPPPVQTVEVQVYHYVAGSTPNTQVPVLLNSQTFNSVSLPQALNVSLNGLTPGPIVLHVWGWSTGGVTIYPSVVNFNYIPPNTALAAGEQHDFLFNANAGDTLEFDLNALTGDPNMSLWMPFNFVEPTWYTTTIGSDYLNENAPVSGEYLLSVYGESNGNYTLSTKRNGVPYARRAPGSANNANAYVPDGRPTFSEPIPEVPKAVVSSSISLQRGWNHTTLSVEPLVGYSAESLCDQINEQGGDAVEINRWHNAGWDGHVCGLPFNDFDLQLGESYFIRSDSASTWSIEGLRVTEALPLTVQVGWNSIAIPHTDSYTAESLCDDMISQGVEVVEIDRWHNSGWQGHICGVPFNDFNIERHSGYFVKSNSSGSMSLTARSVAKFRMRDQDLVKVPSQADSTAQAVPIHDLQRSNVRDTSVTLSWITQQATTGYVYFGETPETMSKVAYDTRGALTARSRRTTHLVVLNELMPETTYYFEIISSAEGQERDPSQRSGEAYTVTTLSPLDNVPPSDTIYGQIYQADGVTPATGTLVYLQLQDADDAGSAGEAGLIVALVNEQGYWHANLGNARLREERGSFAYSIQGDRIRLTTQRAVADSVTHTFDSSELRPAQPLTLQAQERNFDRQLYLPLIQN